MQTSQNKSSHLKPHKNSTPKSHLLEIKRNFSMPLEQLYKAFTNTEAIKLWWWPKGLYTDHVEMDFTIGGKFFINMKGFDQGGGGMTGNFVEIVENERIVMSDSFADEKGNAITAEQAKIPGEWPKLVYITLEFSSVDEHTSQLVLSQEGIPNELQKDCIQGWNESFDKLEEHFSTRKQ